MSISASHRQLLDAIDKLEFLDDPSPRHQSGAKSFDWTVPGFLGRTLIRTTFGEVPVEFLRVNDPIVTSSGRVLPVRHIDRINLDREFLVRHPEAQPVRICAHAFGPNLPQHDLIISPGQSVTVATRNSLPHGTKAKDLKGNGSVIAAVYGRLTYHILDLGEPATVFAEGIPVLVPNRPQIASDEDEQVDGTETTAPKPEQVANGFLPNEGSAWRRRIANTLARLAG